MSDIKCPECGSDNVCDLDCDECNASGMGKFGQDDCENCKGLGYLEGGNDCLNCGHAWEGD